MVFVRKYHKKNKSTTAFSHKICAYDLTFDENLPEDLLPFDKFFEFFWTPCVSISVSANFQLSCGTKRIRKRMTRRPVEDFLQNLNNLNMHTPKVFWVFFAFLQYQCKMNFGNPPFSNVVIRSGLEIFNLKLRIDLILSKLHFIEYVILISKEKLSQSLRKNIYFL